MNNDNSSTRKHHGESDERERPGTVLIRSGKPTVDGGNSRSRVSAILGGLGLDTLSDEKTGNGVRRAEKRSRESSSLRRENSFDDRSSQISGSIEGDEIRIRNVRRFRKEKRVRGEIGIPGAESKRVRSREAKRNARLLASPESGSDSGAQPGEHGPSFDPSKWEYVGDELRTKTIKPTNLTGNVIPGEIKGAGVSGVPNNVNKPDAWTKYELLGFRRPIVKQLDGKRKFRHERSAAYKTASGRGNAESERSDSSSDEEIIELEGTSGRIRHNSKVNEQPIIVDLTTTTGERKGHGSTGKDSNGIEISARKSASNVSKSNENEHEQQVDLRDNAINANDEWDARSTLDLKLLAHRINNILNVRKRTE